MSFCHIFIDYVTDLTRAPTMTAAFLSWPTRLAEAAATLLHPVPIGPHHESNAAVARRNVTLPAAIAEMEMLVHNSRGQQENPTL